MDIKEFRQKYPDYNDISDEELSKSFHKKYYSDIPYEEFSKKFLGEKSFDGGIKAFGETIGGGGVGLADSLIRMPWNMVGGSIAKGVGALTGLATGEDLNMAMQRGNEAQERVSIDPFTKRGQMYDEALGRAYEEGYREPTGGIVSEDLRYDINAPKGSPRADPRNEAKARSFGEFGADVLGMAGIIRGGVNTAQRSRIRASAEREAQLKKIAEESNKTPDVEYIKTQTDQAHAPLESGVRAPQYGMGEVPREIPRDMFGQPEILPPVVRPERFGPETRAAELAIDAQTPRSPYEVQRTPAQLEKLNQSPVAPDPSKPFYADPRAGLMRELPEGRDITRAGEMQEAARTIPFEIDTGALDQGRWSQGAKPLKYQETPFERPPGPNDPLPFTREPIEPTTRPNEFLRLREEPPVETVLYERVTPNDKVLNNLQDQLSKKDAQLSRLLDEQSRLLEEHRSRDLRSPTARKELTRVSQMIEKSQKDVARLKDLVEKRTAAKDPTLGKGAAPRAPRGQRGAIDPDLLTLGLSRILRKSAKPEPKVPVADPMKRQSVIDAASGETRPWSEFWQKHGPEIQDLPDTKILGIPWNKTIEYFSNAQILYHDTKNAMVKYIADVIANEKSVGDLKAEYSLQGIQFNNKGLLPKKIIDPDSPYSHFLGLTKKERQTMTDIINRWSGELDPTKDQMRATGASQKVINAIEVLQRPIKEALTDINKELIANGRSPIKERPFYFMRNTGTGNWLVRIKDKDGHTIGFHRAETRGAADAIGSQLLTKLKNDPSMGELKTEVVKADPNSRGNKYNISTTLIEDIFQALERNDPRRKALNSAIQDIKSKGGFGAHRAFRKGVQGMDNTPKEFWNTYQKYIEDAQNYATGLKLSNLKNQIQLTNDMPPRLKNWALEYIDRSRGGEPREVLKALENGMDNIVSGISGGISKGRLETAPGATRKAVRFLNKAFTSQALFFYKVPFLAGQALQSTSFAPSIMYLYKNQGYKGSVMQSMAYGAKEMFDKSPEFTKVLDFLTARGKVDPSLVHDFSVLDVTGHSAAQTKGQLVGRQVANVLVGKTIPMKLEALNRVHAAAVGYHFLKDNLSGQELKVGVERFVDDVMGNYGVTDRPGLVTRHGMVGEAIAPLGTFSNWYKGMTAVMLKEMGQGIVKGDLSKAAPFASMWLSTAVMAGVIGAPFFKEIDWLFDVLKGTDLFKSVFGTSEKSPSLTEIVLTSGLPDTGKFGALTGASTFIDPRGVHLTGSMTAPEVMPSWVQNGQLNAKNIAPGVVYGAEAGSALIQIAMDVAGLKNMTVEERRKAWKDIMPSTVDSYLSNLDSTFKIGSEGELGFDGRPVPGGKRGVGSVRRDDFETMASMVGGGTIPEVTEKMVTRDIKEQKPAIGDARSRLVDQAVDAIMYGTGDVNEIAQKAAQMGITNFGQLITKALENKYRTEAERSVGRGTTLQQYENYDYIKRSVQER